MNWNDTAGGFRGCRVADTGWGVSRATGWVPVLVVLGGRDVVGRGSAGGWFFGLPLG